MKSLLSAFGSAGLDSLLNKGLEFLTSEFGNYLDSGDGKLEVALMDGMNLLSTVQFQFYGRTVQNAFQNRVDKLRGLCYDACDLLEDLAQMKDQNSSSLLFSTIGFKTTRMQCKLDTIKKEMKKLIEIGNEPVRSLGNENSKKCPTSPLTSPFIGRNEDVNEIIQELLSNNSDYKGVSILGMDGLGKTTLALRVSKDRRISERFSVIIVDFPLDEKFEVCNLNKLMEQKLAGNCQSLLILFDNLLELTVSDWDYFWCHMRTEGIAGRRFNNTKLLITSFNDEISEKTCTQPYRLKPLSYENCEQVIIERALLHNSKAPRPEINHIAGKLAKKCEGLPMVARMLGAVLGEARDEEQRTAILKKDLWDMPAFEEDIFPRLKSSYLNTPYLARSLIYFSLFPHNYHFDINDLIHLWVAEGFIEQPLSTSSLEDLVKNYSSKLLGRSILLQPRGGTTYNLNRLSHKFSEVVASRTCLRIDEVYTSNYINVHARHLSLVREHIKGDLLAKIVKLKGLRTLLSLYNGSEICQIHPRHFKALTTLRVLVLNGTNIVELPSNIDELKRLRYLDVSNTPIEELPENTSKLYKLQFLKLQNTPKLCYLPEKFYDLTRLQSVDWDNSDIRRVSLPSNIGKLSSLQTLPLFPVGDKKGYFISELGNLNNLGGSICIENLYKVRTEAVAKNARLCDKKRLKRIELDWTRPGHNALAKDVLAKLEPYVHLNELKIRNYGCHSFPDWISNPSRNISNIHLKRCLCKVLPELGKLRFLKSLVIEQFLLLELVDHKFYGPADKDGRFLSLDSLSFKGLRDLKSWIGLESNDMPRLRVLEIMSCPKLTNLPALNSLTSLVELHIVSCGAIISLPDLPRSVTKLVVNDSDLLRARCRVGGEDWDKINCIREVFVDGLQIPMSEHLAASSGPGPGE